MATPTILDAMADPALFGQQFGGDSWRRWRVALAAMMGLRLEGDALEIFRRHTGRMNPPARPFQESYIICGRRAGKSNVAALVLCYLAAFVDWMPHLSPGETCVLMCLASDRRQAKVVFSYCRGLLESSPLLKQLVTAITAERIELASRRVVIEVHTSSYKSARGFSLGCVVCDEIAFWESDTSSNPDQEVLRALRPGLASLPDSLLLCISSPYSRAGELWRAYRQFHGQDEASVLTWQARSRDMNPNLDQKTIDAAFAADPIAAESEWNASFRSDIESYISIEALEQVTVAGRLEIPPQPDVRYCAFVDPSGGASDSMALAISHREGEVAVLDLIREARAPFNPGHVTAEFVDVLKKYSVKAIEGDRYSGEWVASEFRRHGIEYKTAALPKSQLYAELLPAINTGVVELLDLPKLRAQLAGLERRTSRSGKDSIDHRPGGHDDIANCVGGALVAAMGTVSRKTKVLVVTDGGAVVVDRSHPLAVRAAAQRVAERALAIFENFLGPHHPSTVTVRENLRSLE